MGGDMMRKITVLLLAIMLLLTACSCSDSQEQAKPEAEDKAQITQSEKEETDPGQTKETAESSQTKETRTTTKKQEGPVNTAKIYSSYAYMVSYDPARGWADFDYFNALKGDKAVAYLVSNDGYSPAEAQEMVDNFADQEFVCQNDNPQLRTINLQEVDLKLMYYPDGTEVTGATPIDAELIDLYNLYEVHPEYVLDSFFYYITVQDDQVVSVEQVYRP